MSSIPTEIPIATLRKYFASCDPNEPLMWPEDPRYVELDDGVAVRGDDGSCIESLKHILMIAEARGKSCQLFTGYSGTGKTTELYRLKRDLERMPGDASHVVFLDAELYLDRYTPLTISDMLRVIAYHLDGEATRAEGNEPDQGPGYLTRLWGWLQSDIDLKEVGFERYGAKLMFEIKDNPNFRQKAEEALQLRFREFAEEARQVIDEAVHRLRKARKASRIVLIVDGLEKMTALRPEDRPRMEESIEMVFSSHAEWLKLPCHVIYTFPLWLRFRTTDLSTRYHAAIQTLPMIKVRHRDGGPHEEGIDRLAELVRRRLEDPEPLFGADWKQTLRPLLEASGGYPRDLLRLVRDAITRARSFPIAPKVIQRVIELLTEEYEMGARLADLDVVAHIARTQSLPLGAEKLQAASWLFDRWLILTYRNGKEWYDIHPLALQTSVIQARLAQPEEGGP